MIELEIPKSPIPWAASKVGKKGHFNPRGKDKLWTQWQIKALYKGKPIEGYIVLEIKFIDPMPLSASKKEKQDMLSGKLMPVRCDLTNCIKFIEDCLKNIVFMDDRYVAKNISEKLYGDKGKTLIKVYPLDEYRKTYADRDR
jgi:Holliday junction resolvase RusA-like endonuclease